MNTYLKYKPAWVQLLIFGSLAFGIFLGLSIISLLIVTRIFQVPAVNFQTLDLSSPGMISAVKVYQAIAHVSLFLIPSLAFAYFSHSRPLQYVGIKKPIPPVFWIIAVVIIIGAFPMVAWLGEINQNIHLPASLKDTEQALRDAESKNSKLMQRFLSMNSITDLLSSLLILAVLPALLPRKSLP